MKGCSIFKYILREIYMVDDKLIYNPKQNDDEPFKELYEKYRNQVYYTVYSVFKDKETSKELLKNIFVKMNKELKKVKAGTDFEDWLYSVTADVIRKYKSRNRKKFSQDNAAELMGFIYEFPFMLRDEKPTEEDYNSLFEEICSEIQEHNSRKSRKSFRVGAYEFKYTKVAATLLIIALLIPFVYIYMGRSGEELENTKIPSGRETYKSIGIGSEVTFIEIRDYDKTNRYTPYWGSSLLSAPGTNKEFLCHLKGGTLLKVVEALQGAGGSIWLNVSVEDEDLGEVTGWLPESDTVIRLAETYREDRTVRDEDIWALVDKYLTSLCGEEVPLSQRITEYKIISAGAGSLIAYDYIISGGHLQIYFQCELKPFDTALFSLLGYWSEDDEYMQTFSGTVELHQDAYVLVDLLGGEEHRPDSESARHLKKNGLIPLLNSGYSYKLVPTNISMELSDIPELHRLYLAYCNELSKACGYDFLKHMGSRADIEMLEVVRSENLTEQYALVTVTVDNVIQGAWLESLSNYNKPKKFKTLDNREFDSIVEDKAKWIKSHGFKGWSGNFERILELASTHFDGPLLVSLFTSAEGERINKAFDIAVNGEKDEKLIKNEFVIRTKNEADLHQSLQAVLEEYLSQFKNKKLSKYSRIDDYQIGNVYALRDREGILNYWADGRIKPSDEVNIVFNRQYYLIGGFQEDWKFTFNLEELHNGYKVNVRGMDSSIFYSYTPTFR
jgi:DNA-directed RNA polymerase specialized sigma24 family protein